MVEVVRGKRLDGIGVLSYSDREQESCSDYYKGIVSTLIEATSICLTVIIDTNTHTDREWACKRVSERERERERESERESERKIRK